jgi:hypothetical protein
MGVILAEADGLALPRHGGKPYDGALLRLAVDLGQHDIRRITGEGNGYTSLLPRQVILIFDLAAGLGATSGSRIGVTLGTLRHNFNDFGGFPSKIQDVVDEILERLKLVLFKAKRQRLGIFARQPGAGHVLGNNRKGLCRAAGPTRYDRESERQISVVEHEGPSKIYWGKFFAILGR